MCFWFFFKKTLNPNPKSNAVHNDPRNLYSSGSFDTNSNPSVAGAVVGQGGIIGDATGSDNAVATLTLTKPGYTATKTLNTGEEELGVRRREEGGSWPWH